jgi:hypothetical protein
MRDYVYEEILNLIHHDVHFLFKQKTQAISSQKLALFEIKQNSYIEQDLYMITVV